MPSTRITHTTVYELSELDEATQQRAHSKWQETNLSYDWWDCTYTRVVEVASLLGIEISSMPKKTMGGHPYKEFSIGFSGFSSQGDGAHFEGYYKYEKCQKALLPEDTVIQGIAKDLQQTQKKFFYKLIAKVKHSGHYQHSGCTNIEVSHADDSYRDIGDAEDQVISSLRRFMNWIYKQLENEYEFLNSFEQFKESAEANEYEFDSSGVIV